MFRVLTCLHCAITSRICKLLRLFLNLSREADCWLLWQFDVSALFWYSLFPTTCYALLVSAGLQCVSNNKKKKWVMCAEARYALMGKSKWCQTTALEKYSPMHALHKDSNAQTFFLLPSVQHQDWVHSFWRNDGGRGQTNFFFAGQGWGEKFKICKCTIKVVSCNYGTA